MIGDLEGPGAWHEHRLRAAVPAHRDQPPIYGGDHAAPGDAADLLRLHQHPVANLDHRRLLWMVTKPGHSRCPQDRRLHSRRAAVAIALALPVVLQVAGTRRPPGWMAGASHLLRKGSRPRCRNELWTRGADLRSACMATSVRPGGRPLIFTARPFGRRRLGAWRRRSRAWRFYQALLGGRRSLRPLGDGYDS